MSSLRWYAPMVVPFAALALLISAGPAAAEPTPAPTPGTSQTALPNPGPTTETNPASTTPGPSTTAESPSATPAPSTLPLQFGPANARATMIAFSWTPAPGAAGYRLILATTPGGLPLRQLDGARTTAMVSGLTANTRYWAQLLALDATGVPLGAPSSELEVTTPFPLDAPLAQATVRSSVSLELSWLKPAKGTRLQLEWTAPDRKAKRSLPTGHGQVRSGLKPGTTYSVRVRVLKGTKALSAWSEPLRVTTPEGDPLRVGSYNVLCANCKAWGPRRQGVADTIVSANLDVVGLQEASAAELPGTHTTQYQDLARLLAPAGYRLTNPTRFNCARSNSSKNCRRVNHGASSAVRIAYNTATVRLISTGSRQLADLPGYGADRYIAWAVLEHRINGKRFLFTSTHLEPRNDSAGSRRFYNIRNAQARAVAQTIAAQRGNLPVIAVGDYNSTKWDVPSNGPYDIMRSAGFVDPLGNGYRSTTGTSGATVEKRINTQYASYNELQVQARRTDGVNGSNPDYIFVSPMRVLEWETVLKVNAAGRFIGSPPSDHNLIRATVLLP